MIITKSLRMFSIVISFLNCLWHVAAANADEVGLKAAIQTVYPDAKVERVTATTYGGLYEVYMDGQIFYADEKFRFLLVGAQLMDNEQRKNITSERMDELTKIDFATLPLEHAIKDVRGDGSRKLAVFSDPDCPYCQQLEQQSLKGLDNVSIYTYLFPLTQLHPDAVNKAQAIWCAPDRLAAWKSWIFDKKLPVKASACKTPIEQNLALGEKLHVSGTPTLITGDGKQVNGALSTQDIEARLKASLVTTVAH